MAPVRIGPRPLPLHLTTAALTWCGASALPVTLPMLKALTRDRSETALIEAVEQAPPAALAAAVAEQAERRFRSLCLAIDRYHADRTRRDMPEPPTVWRQGSTRLLDYGGHDGAPPVMIVPSLINRYYVLDLSPSASFVGALRAAGLRPLVVDWGTPGPLERQLDLTGYVDRLSDALSAVSTIGGPVALLGYCMGGLLALALAHRHPADIAALALLATPWDFHADRPEAARAMAAWLPLIEPLLQAAGAAPIDLLQTLFFLVDPFNVIRKFLAFGRMAADDPRAAHFVLIEDWLADGVPVAAPVFRECLAFWYGENRPARLSWRIGGDRVDPTAMTLPCAVVIPGRDRIVPPASASALAAALPNAIEIRPRTGHIGMVAGRSSRDQVALPLAEWLTTQLRRKPTGHRSRTAL